jgi:hypothetical protein
MRFKLNLNGPGTTLCALIGIFGAVIPAGLYIADRLLQLISVNSEIIPPLIGLSIGVGLVLLVLLVVLLIVEWVQDRHLDTIYRQNRHRKLPLSGSDYECQYCGNRQVKADDRHCRVCGRTLS